MTSVIMDLALRLFELIRLVVYYLYRNSETSVSGSKGRMYCFCILDCSHT